MSLVNEIRKTFHNALMKFIFINVGVFIILGLISVITKLVQTNPTLSLFLLNNLAVPASLAQLMYKPWTLVTYMFVHTKPFHLFFNLLVLYWFGSLFIEYLGNKKLTYTYIMGGIAGALFYIFAFNVFPLFKDELLVAKTIGASAAVMAIVFSMATLLPNYTFFLLLIGPVRLKYIAFFYLIIDLISIGSINSGGHLAHLGGAFTGFLLTSQLKKGNDIVEKLDKIRQYIYSLFGIRNKIKIVYRSSNKMQKNDLKTKQEIIDQILDKISKSGYESLSKKEKETLFNASKN